MSTTLANFLAGSQTVCGLGTFQIAAGSTATHNVSCRVSEVPPSGITIQIKQNASVIATLSSPGATQNPLVLSAVIAATSGDTLSWVLTSSSATDNQLNTVKSTLNVHIGGLN